MSNAVSEIFLLPVHAFDIGEEAYGLQMPDAYAYTSLSNCLEVEGIDDVVDFSETIVSLITSSEHCLS